MALTKKDSAVLVALEAMHATIRSIEKRQFEMEEKIDYLMRMDVTIGGLDTKLRDVLSREATSSNIARDAYHKWLLSFDQAQRESLVAAVRNERLVNGTASLPALVDGKV